MTPEPRALIEAEPGAMMTDERLQSIYHAATVNGMGVSFSSEAVVEIIDRLRNAEAKLAAISSAKAAEEGVDKLERYRNMSKSMPHEQRGTDAEVNQDAAKHYQYWVEVREKS